MEDFIANMMEVWRNWMELDGDDGFGWERQCLESAGHLREARDAIRGAFKRNSHE